MFEQIGLYIVFAVGCLLVAWGAFKVLGWLTTKADDYESPAERRESEENTLETVRSAQRVQALRMGNKALYDSLVNQHAQVPDNQRPAPRGKLVTNKK